MAQEQATEDRSGEVLEAIRRYRGLTYEELGERVGATSSSVSEYAKGRTQLTTRKLHSFAQALDVDPTVFLMSPDGALAWALENRPNGAHRSRRNRTKPSRRSTCFSRVATEEPLKRAG